MSSRQETLDQIRQYVGDAKYQELLTSLGGEDALLAYVQANGAPVEQPSAQANSGCAITTIRNWLAVIVPLVAGFAHLRNGNSLPDSAGVALIVLIGEFTIYTLGVNFLSTVLNLMPDSADAGSDKTAKWFTLISALMVAIILSVNAYQTDGWGGVIGILIAVAIYGSFLLPIAFVIFRYFGQILGVVIVLGITGLVLYGIFKAGVFVADSTISFFEWLVGRIR
jgi:hypothetical protein